MKLSSLVRKRTSTGAIHNFRAEVDLNNDFFLVRNYLSVVFFGKVTNEG